MTARTIEEKWAVLASRWDMIDNPSYPAWKPFKDAFLSEQLTWDLLRSIKRPALVQDTWLVYHFDIDPPNEGEPGSEILPTELWDIDTMIAYLQSL